MRRTKPCVKRRRRDSSRPTWRRSPPTKLAGAPRRSKPHAAGTSDTEGGKLVMEPIRPGKEVTRGLWERIKGAFKKGAGAAVGNDRLRASGELHEMQADAHIEAAERKIRADELREEAAKEFVEREQKLAEAREEVA